MLNENQSQPFAQWTIIPFGEVKPDLTSHYVIKGVLGRGEIALLIGPPGCGKSFLALDIAAHVAMNKPWFGHKVDGGAVVYIAAEAARSIRNRTVALRLAGLLADTPSLHPLLLDGPLDLEADVDALIAFIKEKLPHSPKLIVIDTFAKVYGGADENSSAEMGMFLIALERLRAATGACILIVHHVGKDSARGPRGHSSLLAATDTEIGITRQNDISIASVTKQREGPSSGRYAFKLRPIDLGMDTDGDQVVACVIAPTDAPESPVRLSSSENLALAKLQELVAREGQSASDSDEASGNDRLISMECWHSGCDRIQLTPSASEDAKRKAFQRAVSGLEKKGRIVIHDEWVGLTSSPSSQGHPGQAGTS